MNDNIKKAILANNKIKETEINENWAAISQMVSRGQMEAEESCLIKVLSQYLERKPKQKDFKLCTKIEREGIVNSYVLAYKDVKLGLITRSFMCDSDILNEETGLPDFIFNCKFDPEVIEVPMKEEPLPQI